MRSRALNTRHFSAVLAAARVMPPSLWRRQITRWTDITRYASDRPGATSGLDPLMEAAFRDCVDEERRDGRTVLLRRLTAAGVRTITCRPPTLEELFMHQYSPERTRVTLQ